LKQFKIIHCIGTVLATAQATPAFKGTVFAFFATIMPTLKGTQLAYALNMPNPVGTYNATHKLYQLFGTILARGELWHSLCNRRCGIVCALKAITT
jgi:hypothetical protein